MSLVIPIGYFFKKKNGNSIFLFNVVHQNQVMQLVDLTTKKVEQFEMKVTLPTDPFAIFLKGKTLFFATSKFIWKFDENKWDSPEPSKTITLTGAATYTEELHELSLLHYPYFILATKSKFQVWKTNDEFTQGFFLFFSFSHLSDFFCFLGELVLQHILKDIETFSRFYVSAQFLAGRTPSAVFVWNLQGFLPFLCVNDFVFPIK